MGLEQSLSLQLTQSLFLSIGEESGEIPIYSLHKIKNLLKEKPMKISSELENLLTRSLLKANTKYKIDSGNDWNCLTNNNLVDAIEMTDKDVSKTIDDGIKSYPKEFKTALNYIEGSLFKKKEENIKIIQEWFWENYEKLLYDTSKKIPYPVILRLRSDLALWISEKINPFEQNINEFVLDVAHNYLGKEYYNPEDAWEAMGGKLFKKRNVCENSKY